jgi:surface carbohydrate biosynthesis protein
MKAAGLRIWHLDEEGGVFAGRDEADWAKSLAIRLDPRVLGPDDKVLTWGEWQNEFYRSFKPSAEVCTTGSPNFDVYQEKYLKALRSADRAYTEGRDGFILINTRFCFANAVNLFGARHFVHHKLLSQLADLRLRLDRLADDGIILYQFIGLISALSDRYPDREIVVRPHPAENPTTYSDIFAFSKNVTVSSAGDIGPWIRRCSHLVHNGCTTAIQADIAGKPVITFVPAEDDSSNAALPNRVGVMARTFEEVIALIDQGPSGPRQPEWRRTISNLDSIEAIAGKLKSDTQSPQGQSSVPQVRRKVTAFDLNEAARSVARLASPKRRRQFSQNMIKFDRPFFASLPELGQAAAAYYGVDVSIERLSRYCFAFTPVAGGVGRNKAGLEASGVAS